MRLSRSAAALASLLFTVALITGCQSPASEDAGPGDAPGAQTEDGGDDTVDPSGERIAWHVEAYDDVLVPFAYGDHCGGDWIFRSGFNTYPIGLPTTGVSHPQTVPLIAITKTDTDSPRWLIDWRTTDSVYTATAYTAAGDFTFEYGPDGQPTGGSGEGTLYTVYPDGSRDEVPDFVRVELTREGPEPAGCLISEERGEYTYF